VKQRHLLIALLRRFRLRTNFYAFAGLRTRLEITSTVSSCLLVTYVSLFFSKSQTRVNCWLIKAQKSKYALFVKNMLSWVTYFLSFIK
jgi:hypothetical protein